MPKLSCKLSADFDHGDRKAIRPLERQRMRPWLLELLNKRKVPGFGWYNKRERSFRISWRHAARHGWSMDKDASLFELWARHTGKYIDGDEPIPKRWKSNFRCALHSLPDVTELKEYGIRKGNNAFRVYKFLDEHKGSKNMKRQKRPESTRRSQRPQKRRRYAYSETEDSIGSESDDMLTPKVEYRYMSEGSEGSASDSESILETGRCPMFQDVRDSGLPVFDKLVDLSVKQEPSSVLTTKEALFRSLMRCPSPIPEDDESTGSSMTDKEVIDMLLDAEEDVSVEDEYHSSMWETKIGAPEMEEEPVQVVTGCDHTYTLLTNVRDPVYPIFFSPAVIIEPNMDDIHDWDLTGMDGAALYVDHIEDVH